MIINFANLQKQKDYKKSVIMNFLIKYYKDLNDTGVIDIPYFVRAKDTYNQLIHNYKDLKYYYEKIANKKNEKEVY